MDDKLTRSSSPSSSSSSSSSSLSEYISDSRTRSPSAQYPLITWPLSYTIVPFPWGLYCPDTLPVYIPLSPREPVNGRFVVSNVFMFGMVVLGSTFLASSRRGLGTSSGFGSDLRDDGLAALRVVMALRSMLSPEPKLSLTFSAGGSG